MMVRLEDLTLKMVVLSNQVIHACFAVAFRTETSTRFVTNELAHRSLSITKGNALFSDMVSTHRHKIHERAHARMLKITVRTSRPVARAPYLDYGNRDFGPEVAFR